jgi:hypothetical protein
MKKNYLTTLLFLLGSAAIINAATPLQSAVQHAAKGMKQSQISQHLSGQDVDMKKAEGTKSSGHALKLGTHAPNTFNIVCSPIFTDNFDGANDTTSLQARGYLTYYRGTGPQGTTATWYQGATAVFNSFNGPVDGYVASNYNSVTATNTIDNWLVLPALNLTSGDILSFYSQSPAGSINPDSIKVMYSDAGDSVPEDLSWVMLGEFMVNINGVWELKSFTIPTSSANGRLAIRYSVVDGGPTGANSNYIGIDQLDVYTPPNIDASMVGFSSPITACGLTATESVSAYVVNLGLNSISGFDVSISVDGGTPVVETVSSTVAAGDSLLYTFTATADLSSVGPHTLQAVVSVTGDPNLCNDTVNVTVNNLAPSTPLTTAYTMGFELTDDFSDWALEDLDGDGVNWDTTSATPHSGTFCLRKAGSGVDDDDWLFTGCLDMTGGASYTLDYWFKNFELANPCSLETFIGTGQNAASMTQQLNQNSIPIDTAYQHAIIVFTVPNNGTYHIGFHAYSFQGTGTSSIRLDDINLDDGTFIGVNEVGGRTVQVYPNPSSGMFALYASSSLKNATVDVLNIEGQLVSSHAVSEFSHYVVDLNAFANGVYNIRVTSNNVVENHRVIVNK